jgi:magnesium chelatase subunit I
VSDLDALAASTMGKVEIEALDDGRDEQIAEHLVRAATLTVFKEAVDPGRLREIVTAFDEGAVVHTGEDITSADLARLVEDVPALRPPSRRWRGATRALPRWPAPSSWCSRAST